MKSGWFAANLAFFAGFTFGMYIREVSITGEWTLLLHFLPFVPIFILAIWLWLEAFADAVREQERKKRR